MITRKIISIFIGACLLINNTSFALCPPIISGTLAQDTHEYKFFALADKGLQQTIKLVNKLTEIINSRDLKFVSEAFEKFDKLRNGSSEYEGTEFNRAEIVCYSNMIDQVGDDSPIFMIPVTVVKNRIEEHYRLLFSTIPDKDGGYPTALCTKEEFEEKENSIKIQKMLPVRDKNSEKLLLERKSRDDVLVVKLSEELLIEIEEYREKLKIDLLTNEDWQKYRNIVQEVRLIFNLYRGYVNRYLLDKKRMPNPERGEISKIVAKRGQNEGRFFYKIPPKSLRRGVFNAVISVPREMLKLSIAQEELTYDHNGCLENVLFGNESPDLHNRICVVWKKIDEELLKNVSECKKDDEKKADKKLAKTLIQHLSQEIKEYCEEQKINLSKNKGRLKYPNFLKELHMIFEICKKNINGYMVHRKRLPMPEEILEILTKCASDEGKFYVGITDSLRQSIMQCVFNVAMKLVEPNIAQKENAWAYDDALKNILSDQTRSNLHERICGVWGEIEKDLFFNNIARDNTKSEILTNIAIHEFSKKIEKYCERLEIDIKTENGLTKYGNLLYELCHIFDVYKQGINRCLFDKKRVPNTLEKKEILKKRALMEGYHFEGITDSLRKDTFNIIYYLALDFLEPYFGLRKKAYTKNEYLKNVLFEENSSTSSLYIALQQEWKKVEKWLDLQKAKYETSIEQLKMRDKELTRSAILKLSQKVLKFCEEQKIDVEDETSEDEYYRILKGTFSIFSIYRNAIHKCLLTKKRMPNQEEKKEIQKKRHVFAETYFEGVPEFFGEYILDIVYDLALQILEPHIALEKDAYVSDKCLEKVLDDDYGFKIRERIWNAWKQIGNWVQSKRKDFAPSVFKKWKQELSETVYSFLEEAFDIIPLDYRYNAVSCQRLRKSFKNEFFEQKSFESINKEKIDTIVNYVDEVFGFLVKGKKCKVSKVNYVSHTSAKWSKKLLKRISTTEGGIYSKDIDKNLTKQQEGLLLKVVSPLAQEEKEIFLEINPKTYFRNPPEKIYRGIRLCLMPFVEKEQDREKYFINVAFSGTRNNREIYVETDKDSFSLTNYSTKEEVRDFLGSVVCEVTRTAPSFVKDTIFENIPDFSKLDEKSALIFSQKVTFDNGVGALLPKLARADIKLGVVAKTEKQKTIIRYINEIELADEKNKIFFAETVAEVVSEIKKDTPRFYYFKIDEDAEETLPRNVILVDKLTVERIIAAIGKACGFVDEKMMPLYEAAQKFAQAA